MIEQENHESIEKRVDRIYAASDLAVFAIFLKFLEGEEKDATE